MRHHLHNRASSSMGDADDGVSSATPSTHRPYIFMQSCSAPQFAADSAAKNMPMQNAPFYSVRAPIPPSSVDVRSMPKSDDMEMVRSSNGNNTSTIEQTTTITSTTAASTTSIMPQRVHPQTNVIYKVSSRPLTPDYAKSYPVMDTTVASSVKGEPELNIGKEKPTLFCRR